MNSNAVMHVDEAMLRAAAQETGAVHRVHPRDLLFDYLVKRDGIQVVPGYFRGGSSDAWQARRALERIHGKTTNLKVLEFAAGYGRVARHWRAVFGEHRYVASDIHPEAVDFLKNECSVAAALSAHEPEALDVGRGYDYIFVLSLFSHLPDRSFRRWLKALYAILADDGALLFTAHGDYARRKFPGTFEKMIDPVAGWGYGRDSDQPDLSGDEYGTMVVTPRYVIDAIAASCPDAQLVRFDAGSWFGLQDEWLIRKTARSR